MRHNEGYHRNRGAWQPTERQRQVLDMLAEGKGNAEIAQRLGITADGAKWHVGELLGETGLEDREALARWWQRQRPKRAPAWILAPALLKSSLALMTVVALALAGVAVFGGEEDGARPLTSRPPVPTAAPPTPWPEEAVAALAKQGEAPSTCEPPVAQDFRIVTPDELRSQGLVDLGQVIFLGHCPVYVANRPDRSVAWLGGGGYVRLDTTRGRVSGGVAAQSIFTTAQGRLDSDPQEYMLTAYALTSSLEWRTSGLGLQRVNPGLLKLDQMEAEGSFLMLDLRAWVPESPGPVSLGPARRPALASDGHLFVDPGEIAGSATSNWLTGEPIDVSGMTYLLRLPPLDDRPIRNDCYPDEGVCSVQLDGSRDVPAPFAGTLRCLESERGEYAAVDSEALNLRIEVYTIGGYKFHEDCSDGHVEAGDFLPSAVYTGLRAFAPDGAPLSLVVTRDGDLYVGRIELRFGCPCEPRN